MITFFNDPINNTYILHTNLENYVPFIFDSIYVSGIHLLPHPAKMYLSDTSTHSRIPPRRSIPISMSMQLFAIDKNKPSTTTGT